MELMACVLLSKLMVFVVRELKMKFKIYCWTDSMVALCWIKGNPTEWRPFVSNRVKTIRENVSEDSWLHVRGKENPADIPSRGMSAKKLIECELWWHGPEFLRTGRSEIFNDLEGELNDAQKVEIEKEVKKTSTCQVIEASEMVISPEKYSNVFKLFRVTALVMRFVRNCKVIASERKLGAVDCDELEEAKRYFIVQVQSQHFINEIQCLSNEELVVNSSLKTLNPVLEEGVLRVGGRLMASDIDEGRKRPVVLPKNSSFTRLLVRSEHEELMHSGVGAVMASLRANYWILGLRGIAKATVRACVVCKRHASKPFSEDTAPLPSERVSSSPAIPFLHVGVDYAGPLFIQSNSGQRKVYILILTCTRIRGVHLELTSSLSTSEFLSAFERFTSRRGMPLTVISDNAKTFKRAAGILSSKRSIRWKFITERAPWHGGFWERLVQSVKVPLRKALHRKIIGFEELQTLLCRIECVINDRPITYMEDSCELCDAFRARQKLLKTFWFRWQSEYLPLLNATFKGAKRRRKISEGDVVLLHGENGKHLWPLARVKTLHPGMDGKVRTASIVCNGKILRRPIQKLFFLESTKDDVRRNDEDADHVENSDQNVELIDMTVVESADENAVAFRRTSRMIAPPQKYGFNDL
jgi:hypothetical protein